MVLSDRFTPLLMITPFAIACMILEKNLKTEKNVKKTSL